MSKSWTETGAMRRPQRVPDYVVVGRVTRAHGVAGEVRVRPIEVPPERLLELPAVACSPAAEEPRRTFRVRRARVDRGEVLLALEGVETRDAAEKLRHWFVEIPGEWVKPLPEGRFYVFELVGCRVETVAGRDLGVVVDVLATGANDVYVVEDASGRQVLIPAVKAMVLEVDVARQRILVDPWPGLLDDDDHGEKDSEADP